MSIYKDNFQTFESLENEIRSCNVEGFQEFLNYHLANQHVWRMIYDYTTAYRNKGHEVGIECIWNIARHFIIFDVKKSSKDIYKLNNNYKRFYARLYNEVVDDKYFRSRSSEADSIDYKKLINYLTRLQSKQKLTALKPKGNNNDRTRV